jgi:hypothetical protein
MGFMDMAAISLWSFHKPGHSLLSGTADPKKSGYSNLPGVMAAYAELHRRLGTDQVIWCYTDKSNYRETSAEMVEWSFRVPIRKVLRFYDSLVWTRIIGQTPSTLTRSLRTQFWQEALAKHPDDKESREELHGQLNNRA